MSFASSPFPDLEEGTGFCMYFHLSTEERWRMEEPCNTNFKKWGSCCSSFDHPSTYLHFHSIKAKTILLLSTVVWGVLLLSVISWKGIGLVVSSMGTKMKGIYKGFKYISQIFVVKEREMDIGYPTDVKHVAHIGWDGPSGSGSAPSWMNDFKTAPDFSATSLGNIEPRGSNSNALSSTWSSQDFEHSMGRHAHTSSSEMFKDGPPSDLPIPPKKHRRRKIRSTSSPKSSSTSRSSRAAKAKATHLVMEDSCELPRV